MSRIAAVFDSLRAANRAALIPFVTAGDPSPAHIVPMLRALVKAGADVVELGVPFSDPMADGPVIQRSSERALQRGVRLIDVLSFVRTFREKNQNTPVVLMGYANPIEAMGAEKFADAARDAGADGVLVVDYPPEEARNLVNLLDQRGLDTIFLLSPTTTDERLREVGTLGRGYLYYVSLRGVTGAAHIDPQSVALRLEHVRSFTKLPVGVGFGIRDAETASRIAAVADAVVIGSRIIEQIEQATPAEAPEKVRSFLAGVRAAMDAGPSA